MTILSADRQDVIMDQACHAARMAAEHFHVIVAEPFTRLRPRMSVDGGSYCALYGDNLQDGVAGFGGSPFEAEQAFNKAWTAKINSDRPPEKS